MQVIFKLCLSSKPNSQGKWIGKYKDLESATSNAETVKFPVKQTLSKNNTRPVGGKTFNLISMLNFGMVS